MVNIIITGATSMIGTAIIDAALKNKQIARIYTVVRPNSKNMLRLPKDHRVVVIPCLLKEYGKLPMLIKDRCDVFYHLAWPRTATYQESFEDLYLKSENIQYVLKAVKAACELKCSKFVGAGSQSEYGVLDVERISPEMPCNPVRGDGIIHLAAGKLAVILANHFNMDCIWMRIFSVYGRFDRRNSMVSSTILKLIRGEHCAFTKSEQMWDYLNAEDIGEAFLLAGLKSRGSHIYCVGSGEARPLKEYISTIRDVVAPGANLGVGELPYPPNPLMRLCADISLLVKDTGWQPKIDFRTGIERLYKHLMLEKGVNAI